VNADRQERNRFLDGVERLGNALPDPALIFVGLSAVLMAISAVGGAAGCSDGALGGA